MLDEADEQDKGGGEENVPREDEQEQEGSTQEGSDGEEGDESDDPDKLWCICRQPHGDR